METDPLCNRFFKLLLNASHQVIDDSALVSSEELFNELRNLHLEELMLL